MSNVGYLLTNTEVIHHGNILYAIELYGHTAGEIRLYVIFYVKIFHIVLSTIYVLIKGIRLTEIYQNNIELNGYITTDYFFC